MIRWASRVALVVLLLILVSPTAPPPARADAGPRVVVFEGFYRYTWSRSQAASVVVNDQLSVDYAGKPVLFLGYDVDQAGDLAPDRYNRFFRAAPGFDGYLPLVMTDSGQQAFWNIQVPDLRAKYRSMIDAEIDRKAQASVQAQYEREENHFTVTVQVTNLSGIPLSFTANHASVHAIVYEVFTGASRPTGILTNTFVRGVTSQGISDLLENNATGTYVLKTPELSPDVSGIKWENLHIAVLVDYLPNDKSGPYDMLQAYALDPVRDRRIVYSVDPARLDFQVRMDNLQDQTAPLTVTSPSPGLNWSISENPDWLSVDPVTGAAGEPATVKLIANKLSPGTQSGEITLQLTDGGAVQKKTIPVSAKLITTYTIAPEKLAFETSMDAPQNQTANIEIASPSPSLTWTVTEKPDWLSVEPAFGPPGTPAAVTVQADKLSPGIQSGSMTVEVKDVENFIETKVIPVTATLVPSFTITPDILAFQGNMETIQGQPVELNLTSPSSSLRWSVTAKPEWIAVENIAEPGGNPQGAPATIRVIASKASLGQQSGNITIQVTDGGGYTQTKDIPVTAKMSSSYHFTPDTLSFQVSMDHMVDQAALLNITSPSASLTWSIQSDLPWLTLSPASGAAGVPATVQVIASKLSPGTQTGKILLTVKDRGDFNEQKEIPISAKLLTTFTVTPNSLDFHLNTGNILEQTGQIHIGSLSPSLSWKVIGYPDWLIIGSPSGTPGQSLVITASVVKLLPGFHSGNITVQVDDVEGFREKKTISVTVQVDQFIYLPVIRH